MFRSFAKFFIYFNKFFLSPFEIGIIQGTRKVTKYRFICGEGSASNERKYHCRSHVRNTVLIFLEKFQSLQVLLN